jgi:adenine-specific DNA-methyltransferase
VDIQPIACQIAKLRLFIALIVDQSIDPNEANYGILPLPNLETKVVAADTLLGFRPGQLRLDDERVRSLEEELKQVRHDYFTVRRYQGKKALRARDRKLCADLARVLADSGNFTSYDTQRIAEWNP